MYADDEQSNEQLRSQRTTEEEPTTLAVKEDKAVGRLRLLVFCTLFATGIALSLGVYAFARGDEYDDFKSQFEAHALKVLDSFNEQMGRKLIVMDSFSKSVTSYALENNLSFPNVTLPHFEMKGLSVRQQLGALRVDWIPLVTDERRLEWEAYAQVEQDWLLPAAERERAFRLDQDARFGFDDGGGIPGIDVYPEPTDDDTLGPHTDSFSNSIFGSNAGFHGFHVETEGPYLVMWQFSPVTPTRGSLNFNFLTSVAGAVFRAALDGNRAVLGNAIALTDPDDPASLNHAAVYAKSLSIGQYRHSLDELAGDPSSMLVYPVFDSFDEDRKFAGVVRASLYWRFYFVGILPVHVEGLICVIENTWNQTFTYRIDGPEVTFLGPGDRHDPNYDDYVVHDFVSDRLQTGQGPVNTAFRQAELDTGFGNYTLRLYPSHYMEEGIRTNKPGLFALLVLVAFLIPSLTFLLYNHVVEHRQTVVMDQAVATSNIVSSLFPDNVANRLMDESKAKDGSTLQAKNSLLRQFEKAGSTATGPVFQASAPIADSFEACTVMFGDLSGFTKWSANRAPGQVFVLLESIYFAFDEIAERRNVFKVETIGDCYVAVTGVPNRQHNHAVIMAEFARDCIECVPRVIHGLEDKLGEGTTSLQLRVGLHSGPVTAGVLRGQKSRFQLFGDTMNTTARMESNGVPGRIHISKTTADELIAKGKTHWVVPRSAMIEAKGKGTMQTYWLEASQ